MLGFHTNVEARISIRPVEYFEIGEALERRCAEHDLWEAIGAIMRDAPGICAADVRVTLDATALGLPRIPRKRAIQLHMQAIRRATLRKAPARTR